MVERIENKLRIKVFPKGQMEIIYFYIFQHFQKEFGVLESSHKMILLSIYYTPIQCISTFIEEPAYNRYLWNTFIF